MASAHLRIARPTAHLPSKDLDNFYIVGLGMSVLAAFKDHAGFDGLIIGFPGAAYHLEFTWAQTQCPEASKAPSDDNLLVLYLPDESAYKSAIERMREAGCKEVTSANPYWSVHGATFEDVDGWRVVLQGAAWGRQDVAA